MHPTRIIHRVIWVRESLEAVPLDFHLPESTRMLVGLHVGIIDRIPAVESDIMHFGEYALSFRGQKKAILSGEVDYLRLPPSRSTIGEEALLTPVEVCLSNSRRISGYYHDLDGQREAGKPFIPYRVRFTFQTLSQ